MYNIRPFSKFIQRKVFLRNGTSLKIYANSSRFLSKAPEIHNNKVIHLSQNRIDDSSTLFRIIYSGYKFYLVCFTIKYVAAI